MDTPLEPVEIVLRRQRCRIKARLQATFERIQYERSKRELYDIEIRKQPGTLFCISVVDDQEKNNREPRVY